MRRPWTCMKQGAPRSRYAPLIRGVVHNVYYTQIKNVHYTKINTCRPVFVNTLVTSTQ